MGNSSGAFISVQLDNPKNAVYGGCKLTGKVLLNVENLSVSAESLNLKLYGGEYSKVEYSASGHGKNSKRVVKHAYDSSEFISIDHVLACYSNGHVEKGKYEYPFEITLPKGLPARQGEQNGDNYFAVHYFLEARLHRQGMLKWDVINNQKLPIIDAPYDIPKTPIYIEPKVFPINFFCCFSSGSIVIGSRLESNQVRAGDEIKLYYEVQNLSTSNIKAVEISVTESVKMKAKSHYTRSSKYILTHRIEKEQLLQAGQAINPNKSSGSDSYNSNTLDQSSMLKRLQDGANYFTIKLPKNIRPSYNGKCGGVSYQINIAVKTPFMIDDPVLDIPLFVFSPKPLEYGFENLTTMFVYEKPNDWHAIQAPVVHLGINYEKNEHPTDFDHLFGALSKAKGANEVAILSDWLRINKRKELSPEQFEALFSTIENEQSRFIYPILLIDFMPGKITAKHVANAAKSGTTEIMSSVALAFKDHIIDKHNIETEFSSIPVNAFTLRSILHEYQLHPNDHMVMNTTTIDNSLIVEMNNDLHTNVV